MISPQDSASRFTPEGWRPPSTYEDWALVALAGRIAKAFHQSPPQRWQEWCAQEGLEVTQGVVPPQEPVEVLVTSQQPQVRLLDGLWDVLLAVRADGHPRGCLVTVCMPLDQPLLTSRPALVP